MKARVYMETSVIGYLTGRPSRDLVTAAHQQITHDWWECRNRFDLFVSQAVLAEAARGDRDAAARRLEVLKEVTVIPVTDEATDLAERLISEQAVADKAAIDAVHVAVAVVNGMDYLVTWNCAHIATAGRRASRRRSSARPRNFWRSNTWLVIP
jgi:predicted nucleic acid-binding protein